MAQVFTDDGKQLRGMKSDLNHRRFHRSTQHCTWQPHPNFRALLTMGRGLRAHDITLKLCSSIKERFQKKCSEKRSSFVPWVCSEGHFDLWLLSRSWSAWWHQVSKIFKGDPEQRNIKIKMECYKYTHGCFSVFLRSSWLKINVWQSQKTQKKHTTVTVSHAIFTKPVTHA